MWKLDLMFYIARRLLNVASFSVHIFCGTEEGDKECLTHQHECIVSVIALTGLLAYEKESISLCDAGRLFGFGDDTVDEIL